MIAKAEQRPGERVRQLIAEKVLTMFDKNFDSNHRNNISINVRIVGGPGSGKTYISKYVEEELNTPCYSLDNIYWSNDANSFSSKTEPKARDEQLGKILGSGPWIIEGVYFDWCYETLKQADIIYIY